MIETQNVSVRFGSRTLYDNVNLKFTDGNCYGLIGANGAGKSTFLRVLSGELKPDTGTVIIKPNETVFTLKQDHFAFDEYTVLETVLMGNTKLYEVKREKDEIYCKEDFSEADGIRAGELEAAFADMDGWNAESNAATLLNGLGISVDLHDLFMKELSGSDKVKVLLAQALFGKPNTLLLDEPTNHLDIKACSWLEHFLMNYENTVIVVSHDRHFLNKVCTHIADVDYGKIKLFAGNYDFWYESSQLISRQLKDANSKKEEKIKELEDFIARFSANASKSRQATSRKKILDKITLDDLQPSTRKYPFIEFKPERESGRSILYIEDVEKQVEDCRLTNISFNMMKGDKVALIGDPLKTTLLLKLIAQELTPDAGSIQLGQTIRVSYIPDDNSAYFEGTQSICDWLSQYTDIDDMSFIRGFLGRMLFSGEEPLKPVNVLSGGEKARCMLSKMMISGANVLMLDEPTDHLDMESIDALNRGMIKFPGVMIFSSRDHQIVQTTANRIMEIINGKLVDKITTYDEYLESDEMARKRFTFTLTESEEADD